jgi:hypothetical protein
MRPVIISTQFFDKTVECSCGVFIVINDEGWVITVAHLFETDAISQQHLKEVSNYKSALQAIQQNVKLNTKQKNKHVKNLKINKKWITNCSYWWGSNNVKLDNVRLIAEGDLAIGQLKPFDQSSVKAYPIFKNLSNLDIGTSLCKLGYPFHKIEATFDETNNSFELAPNTFPLPLFPIEGIYTRNLILGKSKDEKYVIKFLETSSPGLRGQSGGPIFDAKGTVWAVQSRTSCFPMGFSPIIERNGRKTEENQFLNVGLGVHPELIVAFLNDNKIKFNLSEY